MANYKCPKCGAPIVFKPEVGGFKCDYCFSTFSEEELTASIKKEQSSGASKPNASGVKGYTCANCGAEVIAGETSNTAYCYYCHSPIVITDRLQNEFKPDLIIPFKIDKKTAVSKFIAWAKKKHYTPKDFTSVMQQEKMTGIYLPYWQADFVANVNYSAVGVSVKTWISNDTEYTKTTKTEIKRSGKVDIDNMQELAFSKVDKNLINTISNFDESEQRPFSQGYLAGFFSEQYDIPKEHSENNLLLRAKDEVKKQISASHNDVRIEGEKDNTSYKTKQISYTLLPVWILSYIYKSKPYIFAVNGQTGEIAGEAPLSPAKLIFASLVKAAVVIGLLILGGLWIW